MPSGTALRRLDLGYFIRPAGETGTGRIRVEPVLGYLVRAPGGLLLFDTGLGSGPPELDRHYRPVRRDLHAALRGAGVTAEDIRWVVNCHLHFDHCGGNPTFPGRPVFVQRVELTAARQPGYTLPQLVEFPGACYQQLDGAAELAPGVNIVPTPGHTDGHQSLLLRGRDGTVILAGQAHQFAGEFSSDYLAWRAGRDGSPSPLPAHPEWMAQLAAADPARVLFAHDLSVWEPP